MHDNLKETGATLVAVSPQGTKYSAKMKEDHGLDFPVLSDEGNQVASQYGLTWELPDKLREVYEGFGADLSRFNADGRWTLPMPARYVIREDGTIAHADVHADYTQRPEPAKTLQQVQELALVPAS